MVAVGRFPRVSFRKRESRVVDNSVTGANVVLGVISREGLRQGARVSFRAFRQNKRQEETYEDRV